MFCSKCGTQMSDDAVFCPKCGIRIQGGLQNNSQDENVNLKRKKNNIIVFIIIAAICLMCFGVLIAVIMLNTNSKNDKQSQIAESKTNEMNFNIISGVYTKMGWYQDLDDPHGHTVKLCKYCVEFFDDGSAIWWENVKLYETPQYYVCQYHYNEGDNDITLIISDGNERTIIISVYEDYIMLTGEGFKNDVFRKGTYDDITEAVSEISEDYISAEDYEYINDH